MKFESLLLHKSLLRSLVAAGYEEATPIQEKAIPEALKGRDLIGCAQTGTGKTAAFALPTLQQLMKSEQAETGAAKRRKRSGKRAIRSLILAPTRELAGQIADSLRTYGEFTSLRHAVIYGGVSQVPQVKALKNGIDILVATPGRLLDLIGQGFVNLNSVEILILDEADQMLDMGFIHDLRKIVATVPSQRQTLMFSATMPPEIRKLTREWLTKPCEIKATAVASTPERVSQTVYFVEQKNKRAMLTRFLKQVERSKTLVFSRTRRGADRIAQSLERDGIHAVSIHGDKSQAKRRTVMRQFSSKRPPVLVATDLAARGLDFSDVSHVINYDLPDVPETYVHRIGRTARAGADGQAVSFCQRDERKQLRMIEKLTGQSVVVEKLVVQPNKLPPPDQAMENSGEGTAAPSGEDRAKIADKVTPKKKKRPHFRARRNARGKQKGGARATSSSKGRGYAKSTS